VELLLRELVNEERRELFANLKDLENVIRHKWHDVDDETMRKDILQWKRCLAAVAKQNGGPIQQIFCWSVDWWLLWHSGVGTRTSDNINDEPLANIFFIMTSNYFKKDNWSETEVIFQEQNNSTAYWWKLPVAAHALLLFHLYHS